MHVSYLINELDKKNGTSLALIKVTGTVQDEVQALEWAERLMSAVYEGEFEFHFPRALLDDVLRLWHPTVTSSTSLGQSSWRRRASHSSFIIATFIDQPTQKKGVSVFSRIVEPIFRAAGCQLHVTRS